MAARPPPPLPDELVEAILLRIPPDDPASLMRAALACKHWCRLVTGAAFRRGFLQVHRTPPMLGVLHNSVAVGVSIYTEDCTVSFFPTCSSHTNRVSHRGYHAIDARHGRVLLQASSLPLEGYSHVFHVWNPITDERRRLPPLRWVGIRVSTNFKAAVLCARGDGGGCDHLDCHRGPFLVVFVDSRRQKMFSYIYSSEADAWSKSASAPCLAGFCESAHAALVDDSLYFVLKITPPGILKYDLGTRDVTVIDAPPMKNALAVLMTAEGGGLGCGTLDMEGSKLCLWSREVGPDGDIRWTLGNAIEFSMPMSMSMPTDHSKLTFDVVGFANGDGVVFVGTNGGAFSTGLKSGCFKQVSWDRGCNNAVPYLSFCTPALLMASTDEDPKGGEPPAPSSKEIKNLSTSFCDMAPEVLSTEALSCKKKPVETIGQSKATGEDKEARDKANAYNKIKNKNEDMTNKRAKR